MNEAEEIRAIRLATLLANERPADDPEVRAWFAADPSLAAEFAELQAVAAAVDRDAARERAWMARAADLPENSTVGAGAAVGRTAHGAPAGPVRPATGRRWWFGVMAAAAALLAGYCLWPAPEGATRDDHRVLSGGPLRIETPVTTPGGGLLLAWRVTRPAATFEAVLYHPNRGRRAPLLTRPEAQEASAAWHLSPAEAAGLPPGTRLWVVAHWPERSVEQEQIVR
jgi:hypothetical protein